MPETLKTEAEGRDENSIDIVGLYFDEIGLTPLLKREEQYELGRAIEEASTAIAALARTLPEVCKKFVLSKGELKPSSQIGWEFEKIELLCAQLNLFEKHNTIASDLALVFSEIRRWKKQLESARDKLIEANLRLSVHLAKKYSPTSLAFNDFIQEGNIGLMKAVEKYDWRRGYAFSTYAYWWVRQAIQRALGDKSRLIRFPVHIEEKIAKIKRVRAHYEAKFGRPPTPVEIAELTQMKLKHIEFLLEMPSVLSLDNFVDREEDSTRLEAIPDRTAVSPEAETALKERDDMVRAALMRLKNKREREVLKRRFGIDYPRTFTLEEIGQDFKLSRERIRQIENTAKKKFEKILEEPEFRNLREFVGRWFRT